MKVSGAQFLTGFNLRKVTPPAGCAFGIIGLAIGKGASSPLEVLAASSHGEPNLLQVRDAWKKRQGGRAAPLLLAVLHGGKATLCGPSGDEPATYSGIEIGRAERLCREALEKPDRHAALRWLRDALPSMDSRLPGLRNEGFLATHELDRGARHLKCWAEAERRARPLLQHEGDTLLRAGANDKKIAVECGPLEAKAKTHHIHELDAAVAHLYGLTEKQLVHIFETFHEGWDYADRLDATLKHFHACARKIRSRE